MLQNNTSGKAKHATIHLVWRHFLTRTHHTFGTANFSRQFEKTTYFTTKLTNIACRVAYYKNNLFFFVLKTSQIKENGKKIIHCLTLSTNRQSIYSLAD